MGGLSLSAQVTLSEQGEDGEKKKGEGGLGETAGGAPSVCQTVDV